MMARHIVPQCIPAFLVLATAHLGTVASMTMGRGLIRRHIVKRHEVQQPVFEPRHGAELGLAEACRVRANANLG
jgi:hypothetical protein